MRFGRALLAGMGWAATLRGIALCVLIFLSAYVAFDGDRRDVGPRDEGVIELPSVPEAEVPGVPLGRPPGLAAPAREGGAALGRGTPRRRSATPRRAAPTPTAPGPGAGVGDPPGSGAPSPTPARPAPSGPGGGGGDTSAVPSSSSSPEPSLGDTTREVIVETGDTAADVVDVLAPPRLSP